MREGCGAGAPSVSGKTKSEKKKVREEQDAEKVTYG